MASLGNTFDPTEVPEDERSFDPLPAGDYVCQIVESDVVQTSKGGDMLKLTLEVVEGPYSNRKVWDQLNIRNANPQAQSIAHRALADICAAVGAGAITDSEELHFKPLVAQLKIEPAREVDGKTYDAKNGVKRYKPRGGQAPQQGRAGAPAQRAAAQPARGATGARPWNARSSEAARTARQDDDIPF